MLSNIVTFDTLEFSLSLRGRVFIIKREPGAMEIARIYELRNNTKHLLTCGFKRHSDPKWEFFLDGWESSHADLRTAAKELIKKFV